MSTPPIKGSGAADGLPPSTNEAADARAPSSPTPTTRPSAPAGMPNPPRRGEPSEGGEGSTKAKFAAGEDPRVAALQAALDAVKSGKMTAEEAAEAYGIGHPDDIHYVLNKVGRAGVAELAKANKAMREDKKTPEEAAELAGIRHPDDIAQLRRNYSKFFPSTNDKETP